MKNKKGFTLIELIIIIAIIGIVLLIVFPSVQMLRNRNEAKKYEYYEKVLKEAAKTYVDKKKLVSVSGNGGCQLISINELKKENLVKDFKSDEYDCETGTYVRVKKENNNTKYIPVMSCKNTKNDTNYKSTDYDKNINNGTCIAYEPDEYNPDIYVLPNAPELDSGMIPIYYDGNIAKKADITKEWYDYRKQNWANVVMVTSAKRATYQNATAGTIINEADVLGYLVWIPRYKYQLFNVAGTVNTNPQTIKIIFEDKNTPKSRGTKNGEYLTHPGFTFGSEELNGIWVGKFETTGDVTTPTIKPNITSLRSQNVSTHFETSRKFTSTTYGLTGDSHMMKNSEWGAVVYLSHSIYGKNSEIRKNNNSNSITGCGASVDNETYNSVCQIPYGSSDTNQPQSTTGNITGIFDMSGGAWEYTMGVLADPSGKPRSGGDTSENSGYTGMLAYGSIYTGKTWPDSKYYNLYTNGSNASNYLGHALGETNGWYGDFKEFVSTTWPWSIRGGFYTGDGVHAGGFEFYSGYGGAYGSNSFRVVRAGA